MTSKKKPQKKAGSKGKAGRVPAAVRDASGELYAQAVAQIEGEAKRFAAAARGEGTPEEVFQAWRDFSALVARTLRSARLWTPARVAVLALILLEADAETAELVRVKAAYDAAGGSKRLGKLITSPLKGDAPLDLVDRLAVALKTTKAEARVAGGYLDETAQPSQTEGGAR